MVRRFCRKYCQPFWSRFVTCVAIGLYLFALAAIPALDVYPNTYLAESSFECSEHIHEFEPPAPEEIDPICELVRLSVPFFSADAPFPLQAGIDSNVSFADLIPPIAAAVPLPPCRAPPAF